MIRDPESFKLLLDTLARFVREQIISCEQQVADTDEIPVDILKEMRGMGLFGFTMEEKVLVSMELCQASPAFRSIVGTNNGIGSQGIVIDGTENQKCSYLPRLASSELIGAFADRTRCRLRCSLAHHLRQTRWRPLRAER